MNVVRLFRLLVSALLICEIGSTAYADPYITLASTTSTEQSGLFGYLLPIFTAAEGVDVHVVAVGTGQALDIARRGDADALLVHDPEAEEKFVAEGHSLRRRLVMYNDFVLVGPRGDPAGIASSDIVIALQRIAAARAAFVSRGDHSGTHQAELRLWRDSGVDPSAIRGTWYKDIGSGMGPALNAAAGINAYVLADRSTWLNFKNRGELTILVSGDQRLFNQYAVMVVNPAYHPSVKTELAERFANWLTSAKGQSVIAAYRIGGEQVFFPNSPQK